MSKMTIKETEIHVWKAYLGNKLLNLDFQFSYLNQQEQERTVSFYFERDRARFIQCRYLLKSTIAKYIGKAVRDVNLKYNEYGKPKLIDNDQELHFNISHSGNVLVLAFSKNQEIGIDIELIQEETITPLITPNIFTLKEINYFNNLNHQNNKKTFYKLWASKEAYLKAIGVGLSQDLSSIEIEFPKNNIIKLVDSNHEENKSYCLVELQNTTKEYVGILAVPKKPTCINYFEYTDQRNQGLSVQQHI